MTYASVMMMIYITQREMIKLRKKGIEFCVLIVIIVVAAFMYVNVGAIIKQRAITIQERINSQYENIESTEAIPLGVPGE